MLDATRKVPAVEDYASYAPPAWVKPTIVVDLAIDRVPTRYLDVQFVRDFVLGAVLFHEIGHYLHYTVGSAQRGGEPSAHDWEVRLRLVHFRKHCRHQQSLREQIRWVIGVIARRDRYLAS